MTEIAMTGPNVMILQRNALQGRDTVLVTTSAMFGNTAKPRKPISALQKQTAAVQMQIVETGKFVQVPITAMQSLGSAMMTMIV